MKLHYRLRILKTVCRTTPVIMIHGLFGNLNNLGLLAANLALNHFVIQVDLRNHGRSTHSQTMNYTVMATDILELLDELFIKKCIVIGYSMGGKVAMTLCMLASQRVSKIVVIDIAPRKYDIHQHDYIFRAIDRINLSGVKSRNEAICLMRQDIADQALILFLLQSFNKGCWSFNFSSIRNNYIFISDWDKYQTWWGPALFIKGELSSYFEDCYIHDLYHQFPRAHIRIVPYAGHWVHRDNPVCLLSIINEFIVH